MIANGMGAALKRAFQGAICFSGIQTDALPASGQRCQVHFMRNILSFTPPRHKATMAEGLKGILRAETAAEARTRAAELAETLEGRADRAIQCLEDGLEDALAVYALPEKYRRRLRTSNMSGPPEPGGAAARTRHQNIPKRGCGAAPDRGAAGRDQ